MLGKFPVSGVDRRSFVRAAAIAPVAAASLAIPSARAFEGASLGLSGDGSDQTAAFIAALQVAAGGRLHLQRGVYAVQPGQLRLPSNTIISGDGQGTIIQKLGNGVLLDISGSDQQSFVTGCAIQDLVLDGASHTGPLVRSWYAAGIVFQNVWSRFNVDIGFDAVQLWDSRFVNCTWDWCSGINGSSPSVLLSNAAATSGFGASTDNTNAVYFVNCRWESFRDGALWLQRGSSNAAMSQVHLVNAKMETSYVRGPFITFSNDVRNVIISNLYLSPNSFDQGVTSPIALIDFGPYALVRLENVSVWMNAPTATSIVRTHAGHQSCSIDNLWVDGVANPTVAIIQRAGGAAIPMTRVGYIKSSPGAVFA